MSIVAHTLIPGRRRRARSACSSSLRASGRRPRLAWAAPAAAWASEAGGVRPRLLLLMREMARLAAC